jgi:alpha-1,6-mannosyltransferase
MHDLLAAVYHKSYHLIVLPSWRPPVAAFVAGLLLRLLGRGRGALAAGLAVLAGWLALTLPGPLWPVEPLARLPGLAVLLLAYSVLAPRLGRFALVLFALLGGWWLRGAPLGGAALASVVPVFLGLWAAMAIALRVGRRDTGWAGIAAAASLAAAIAVSGGAMHWARAALVPASAGLALLGLDAIAPLQLATVLVAAAAVVASDRGRFIPVDAAALAPLLVWFLAPRVQPRLNQAGPALAGVLSAVAVVAVMWGSLALFAHR